MSSILRPVVEVAQFEIKPKTISMLQLSCQFYGLANEDRSLYISNFLKICDTFKQNGVTENDIRLRLFPFSLKDKGKTWLISLSIRSIRTWNQMTEKFPGMYFPWKDDKFKKKYIHIFSG